MIVCSFGQTAIFLIGGKNKQVKPTPILLRSGDIVIMSRDARLAYHGIPRILLPSEVEGMKLIPTSLTTEAITHGLCHWSAWSLEAGEDAGGRCGDDKGTEMCQYCCELKSAWPSFMSYLSVSRINVNVRQVISEEHKF